MKNKEGGGSVELEFSQEDVEKLFEKNIEIHNSGKLGLYIACLEAKLNPKAEYISVHRISTGTDIGIKGIVKIDDDIKISDIDSIVDKFVIYEFPDGVYVGTTEAGIGVHKNGVFVTSIYKTNNSIYVYIYDTKNISLDISNMLKGTDISKVFQDIAEKIEQ